MKKSQAAVVSTVAGWMVILIGAGFIFRFLKSVLQERFPAFLVGLLAVVLVVNIAFLIVWRKRPEIANQLRSRMEADRQSLKRPYGAAARSIFTVAGLFFAAVAAMGGWFMWEAPDFALFTALWVLPSAYLAVAAFYAGLTGKKESYADAAVFWSWLWPW